MLLQIKAKLHSKWNYTANMKHRYNVVLMFDQRRRQWANIKSALVQCVAFVGIHKETHEQKKNVHHHELNQNQQQKKQFILCRFHTENDTIVMYC